jgi:hypothetical protein
MDVGHVRGECKVIRVGQVTVAQGYECSCGTLGCGLMDAPVFGKSSTIVQVRKLIDEAETYAVKTAPPWRYLAARSAAATMAIHLNALLDKMEGASDE